MQVLDVMLTVPDDIAKLGCNTLAGKYKAPLAPQNINYSITDTDLKEDFPYKSFDRYTGAKNRLIKLREITDETPVFAIDTSNIVIGETAEGILCAVRGSVVWRDKRAYQYSRYGPFLFHITERNKHMLYNALRQKCFDAEDSLDVPLLDRLIGQLRFILERWLQKQLCEATQNSLILWDGSLTTRTVKSPVSLMGELLHTARKNHNHILAFSKKTTLSVLGRNISDLIDDRFVPCLFDVDDIIRSQYGKHLRFFGRMYAAKLSPSPFTFRLDIDRQTSEDEAFNALGQLLGNELVRDSYPETLRLAHIFSRFSAIEVLAMQRYVSKNYGLRIDSRADIRQVLFGPYGGSTHFNQSRQRWSNDYDANL